MAETERRTKSDSGTVQSGSGNNPMVQCLAGQKRYQDAVIFTEQRTAWPAHRFSCLGPVSFGPVAMIQVEEVDWENRPSRCVSR